MFLCFVLFEIGFALFCAAGERGGQDDFGSVFGVVGGKDFSNWSLFCCNSSLTLVAIASIISDAFKVDSFLDET